MAVLEKIEAYRMLCNLSVSSAYQHLTNRIICIPIGRISEVMLFLVWMAVSNGRMTPLVQYPQGPLGDGRS